MEQVQPSPVPTVWGFDHVTGGSHAVLLASTPLGQFVHFVEYGNIDAFCGALQDQKAKCQAEANGTGDIVVPSNVLLDPAGNPLKVVPPSQDVQDHLARMAAAANEAGTAEPIDTTAREEPERHLHSVDDPDLGGES